MNRFSENREKIGKCKFREKKVLKEEEAEGKWHIDTKLGTTPPTFADLALLGTFRAATCGLFVSRNPASTASIGAAPQLGGKFDFFKLY